MSQGQWMVTFRNLQEIRKVSSRKKQAKPLIKQVKQIGQHHNYLANRKKITQWFWHFLIVISDMPIMHPVAHPALLACSTALRNLIFMVRKDQVNPSTMNIKLEAEVVSTHCTALYMPPWSSSTPWAVPFWLIRLCSLQSLKKQTVTNYQSCPKEKEGRWKE